MVAVEVVHPRACRSDKNTLKFLSGMLERNSSFGAGIWSKRFPLFNDERVNSSLFQVFYLLERA